jgi:hypothetical protein
MGLFGRKRKDADRLIDLRDAAMPRHSWGSPSPCPQCDGRGYLDHIDPFKEIMYLHCTVCGAKYEITKAETEPAL